MKNSQLRSPVGREMRNSGYTTPAAPHVCHPATQPGRLVGSRAQAPWPQFAANVPALRPSVWLYGQGPVRICSWRVGRSSGARLAHAGRNAASCPSSFPTSRLSV